MGPRPTAQQQCVADGDPDDLFHALDDSERGANRLMVVDPESAEHCDAGEIHDPEPGWDEEREGAYDHHRRVETDELVGGEPDPEKCEDDPRLKRLER